MSKYQFFKRTVEGQDEICHLCVDNAQFIASRAQLLTQGFEVVGYLIYAPNETVAIERFNAEMACPLLESGDTLPNSFELNWYREVVQKCISKRLFNSK
ncbi:hypothetical protein HQN60_12745 [Deefgea piscis]|uniref:Uncharacterized protein n=1 Tax=Deefgea piscis TaxID=2739061 RepID=A0A6M8STP9_9NEIS|nr:hypothetical protein [Deefgea piscis]QKJ67504.1 hypothetical protein HQN60_12745 [Deefgea piscis]